MASAYPRPDVTRAHPFTGWDHLRISAYWFGSNFIWGAFLGPLLAAQMTVLAPLHAAGMVGQIYWVAALPALAVPLLAGPLSDRCRSRLGRRRPYILWGGFVAVVGLLCMAVSFSSRSLAGYIASYFIIQVGANIALAAYSGVIPDQVPREQLGTASGLMAVMSQLGTLAGIIVCAVILKGDYRCLYVMAAVLAFFVAITILTLKEDPLDAPEIPHDWPTYFKSLWIDPREYPDFAWVWLTRAFMMVGFYMISPYILYYLRDIIHVKDASRTSGLVFFIILAAATISGYVGGRLSDDIGRKKLVTISTFVIAVTCVVFIFLTSLLQVLVVGLVFGIGYGTYLSVDWALGTDVLPNKDDAAADMAVWHIAMTAPQIFGPLIAGKFVLDHMISGQIKASDGQMVATYGLPGYAIVFCISATMFFLSGILVKKVKGST